MINKFFKRKSFLLGALIGIMPIFVVGSFYLVNSVSGNIAPEKSCFVTSLYGYNVNETQQHEPNMTEEGMAEWLSEKLTFSYSRWEYNLKWRTLFKSNKEQKQVKMFFTDEGWAELKKTFIDLEILSSDFNEKTGKRDRLNKKMIEENGIFFGFFKEKPKLIRQEIQNEKYVRIYEVPLLMNHSYSITDGKRRIIAGQSLSTNLFRPIPTRGITVTKVPLIVTVTRSSAKNAIDGIQISGVSLK